MGPLERGGQELEENVYRAARETGRKRRICRSRVASDREPEPQIRHYES